MPRLFVAIRPPAPVRDLLIDTMEGIDSARWQDEEQLHLTLRFVGEVDARTADDVADALETIAFPPFELALRGVGAFDKRGRVHSLWAGVGESRELRTLQQKIERACQRCGLEPEHRKFAPHVTVARLNRASGEIGHWLTVNQSLASPAWTVEEFRLYESELGAGGADYTTVARYSLSPGR